MQSFAEQCRKSRLENPTQAEQAFKEILRSLGVQFEREKLFYYANGTKFIIVDYFLRELNCAIELDGVQHRQQAEYDRGRDAYLATLGIRTYRFTNREILTKTQAVKEKIMEMMDNAS